MASRRARPTARPGHRVPWRPVMAEFAGTAVLVALGLSAVIVDFAPHGPLGATLGAGARRAITGLLFGSVGALVTLSPLGRASGAHLNPIVTLAFLLRGKIGARLAGPYVLAQAAGAIAGAATLLTWGATGRAVEYGATSPGAGFGPWWALAGEVMASLAMVLLLFTFLGSKHLRRYTPALFPCLYAVMVFIEAPVSGTSTNPARSLGPAVVSGVWQDWWVYWIGPVVGCLLAMVVLRLRWLSDLEITVARVYHFAEGELVQLDARP